MQLSIIPESSIRDPWYSWPHACRLNRAALHTCVRSLETNHCDERCAVRLVRLEGGCMIVWSARVGVVLAHIVVAQQRALRDTVVMKQVAPAAGWLTTVSTISNVLLTLTLLALVAIILPAAWHFRKSYQRVNQVLDKVSADATPIVRHA